MAFKVVKVNVNEQGTSKETVTLFSERWEAEEFAKTRSLQTYPGDNVRYEIEESTSVPEPLTVGAALKTTSDLIAQAIGLSGGKADLKQIYQVVQKAKPNSSELSIPWSPQSCC